MSHGMPGEGKAHLRAKLKKQNLPKREGFFGILGRFCFFNLALKGDLPSPGMPWDIIIVIGLKDPRMKKIIVEMMS